MFEHVGRAPQRLPWGISALSIGLHGAAVLFVVWLSGRAIKGDSAVPEVILFKAPPAAKPPPPPPPPPAAARTTPKTNTTRIEPKKKPEVPTKIPDKVVEPTPQAAPDPQPSAPTSNEAGGTVGGVVGGVAGGTVGGVVGSDGPPSAAKPKNVPAFVIQRDMLQQTSPKLPEVFKQAHRGQQLAGMYKVCVGLDGKVYQVDVVKSVGGADESIVQGIREGWIYKPQQVPVCFLYNMPIKIE